MAKPKLTKRGNTWYRNGKAVKPDTFFTSFFFVATKLIDDGESYNTLL